MIPYIAILVVIIVAALFATFKRIDPFQVLGFGTYSPKTVSRSTTMGTIAWNEQSKINLLKEIKAKYDALTVLATPTPDETRILLQGTPVGSALTLNLIRSNLNQNISTLTAAVDTIKKSPSTRTLEVALQDISNRDMSGNQLNEAVSSFAKKYAEDEKKFADIVNALDTLYKRSSPSTGAAPGSAAGSGGITTTQTTGTTNTTTATNTGNAATNAGSATDITPSATTSTSTQTMGGGVMLSLNDLIAALAPLNKAYGGKYDEAAKQVDVTKTKTDQDSDYDSAPMASPEYQKEMEERIAKAVAKQIKDNKMLGRSTEFVDPNCPYAPYDSDATQQGVEYVQGRPSPQPDMSEYIRKDSIPCWGCSLNH